MRFFKLHHKHITPHLPCHIGKYTYFGANFSVVNSDSVIGKYCSFGANVQIGTNHHDMLLLTTSPIVNIRIKGQTINELKDFPAIQNQDFITFQQNKPISDKLKPVYIGNDVWVGNNVIIMGGVTVGDGAIVGAGALVTHDVPPYGVVAGVPAKIIKYRFDTKIIKELLNLKWWNRPEREIANMPLHDIEKCIKVLKGK